MIAGLAEAAPWPDGQAVAFRFSGNLAPEEVPCEILTGVLSHLPAAIEAGAFVGSRGGGPAALGVIAPGWKCVTILVSSAGNQLEGRIWTVAVHEVQLGWWSRLMVRRRRCAKLSPSDVSQAIKTALSLHPGVTIVAAGGRA